MNNISPDFNILTDSILFSKKPGITSTPPPPPAFNPLSLANCVLWLDGEDPSGNGVKPANGARVGTWVDKSLGGNSATQGSSFVYPVYTANLYNGLGSLKGGTDFLFGDYYLQIPFQANMNTTELTMMCSFRSISMSAFGSVISSRYGGGGVTTGYNIYQQQNINIQGNSGNGSGSFSAVIDGAPDFTNNTVITLRIIAGTGTWYLSGVSFGTAPYVRNVTGVANVFSVEGSAFPFSGWVSEWVVYGRALSDSELLQLTSYAVTRWGAV